MAQERDVAIRLADDLPPIEVDAAAIELCLVNYISNGIKYSDPAKPERWVEIEAYESASPDGEQEVVVAVRDNGIGIPAEAREHLFERFFRGEAVTDAEGTGLGLSIVRDTVEGLGGRAWAELADGDAGGSTFKIALPNRRHAASDVALAETEPAPESRRQA